MKILLVYGTTEGHTHEIADFVADVARNLGHDVDTYDSSAIEPGGLTTGHDAFIAAGSVHQEKHQTSLRHFVETHLEELNRSPTLFLSASLSAADSDPESQAEAERYIQDFLDETGFRPTRSVCVAGALLYTQYDFFKRFIMRRIVGQAGGDTDTKHDHVYTDWDGLRATVTAFLHSAAEGSQ